MKSTHDYEVGESIAAIAMHIGLYDGKREDAYRAAGESMGGFPGFYRASLEMGVMLEWYAKEHKIKWGENADWILTTEELGNNLLDFMIKNKRLPWANEREQLVKASIRE